MPAPTARAAVALLAALLLCSPAAGANEAGTGGVVAGSARAAQQSEAGRFYLTPAEIDRMKANVAGHEWARIAWERTRAYADAALDDAPQPADPGGDYLEKGPVPCNGSREGWYCGLYQPGLFDGRKAHALALAYAVTGDARYAEKAKEFLLAWARTYNRPAERVGHMIAEPVGFMLKGFMAYDVVQDTLSEAERVEVRDWARRFVARGMRQADHARDRPWVPEAPYGNSATWARALAVTAAAVAGEPELSATLAWNWEHETAAGQDYGWTNLLEGSMSTDGQMTEERLRSSIGYALFTWYPLVLIADIARHVGFEQDLWGATTASGKRLSSPIDYYAPFLTEQRGNPYAGREECCYAPYPAMVRQYRAVMELAYNALPDSEVLRSVVTHGGDATRGGNEDVHMTGWTALTGELSVG
jgi:hypothetical protein